MIHPRLAELCERVWISMKDRMILKDELPRAQMPPNIRIRHVARSHRKQANGDDGHKSAACCEKGSHLRECEVINALIRISVLLQLGCRYIAPSSLQSAIAYNARLPVLYVEKTNSAEARALFQRHDFPKWLPGLAI